MTVQLKAGLIPYRKTRRGVFEFLFMISSDSKFGGDKPMISKGGVETNERTVEAAVREAQEELGLRLENLKASPQKIWSGTMRGQDSSYMLEVFIGEVKNKKDFDIPHYETEATVWMTADKFFKYGRLAHFKLIQAANKILQS